MAFIVEKVREIRFGRVMRRDDSADFRGENEYRKKRGISGG